MKDLAQLLVFEVDEFRCALPLENVIKVEFAVEVIPLPEAPQSVAGMVNVRGTILPVMDIRHRLKSVSREMQLEDRLIIARTSRRKMALWVGRVPGVEESIPEAQADFTDALQPLSYLYGITVVGEDLILIQDLEKFLSDEENAELDDAMEAADF